MTYGASVPSLSGTLTGVPAGDGITAGYSTTATSGSAVGGYPITPVLNDPNGKLGNYVVTSTNGTLTIGKANSLIVLQASAAMVLIDNNVTLTAEVTSTTSGAPTGSVNFMDGSTSLGSSMLDNTGIAVLTLSTLASGAHSVTAVYAGDSSFNNITSGAVIETVQDFQLSGGSGGGSGTVLSATVLPGGIAIYQLQVAPTNGSSFPSAITLSLSGLPPGASYTITPATIAAGSGAQTVVVQVQTVRPLASLHNAPAVSPFLAFGMVLPMLGIVRLRRAMQRREKRRALWLLLLALTTLGMGACGGGSGFFNNAQQTYKMSLTATSGAAQHSINLSLTVQ